MYVVETSSETQAYTQVWALRHLLFPGFLSFYCWPTFRYWRLQVNTTITQMRLLIPIKRRPDVIGGAKKMLTALMPMMIFTQMLHLVFLVLLKPKSGHPMLLMVMKHYYNHNSSPFHCEHIFAPDHYSSYFDILILHYFTLFHFNLIYYLLGSCFFFFPLLSILLLSNTILFLINYYLFCLIIANYYCIVFYFNFNILLLAKIRYNHFLPCTSLTKKK